MPPTKDQETADDKTKDILRTRCKCGAKMELTKTYGTLAVDIKCQSSTCARAYHIPLKPPDKKTPFQRAQDYIPAKEYRCIECKTSIPEHQAIRTFNEIGRALCNICEHPPAHPKHTAHQ